MTQREDVAAAMAFFEATDDVALLHQMLAEIAPRARRMVTQLLKGGAEEQIPPPADLRAARSPARREDAIKTLRAANDFALLQVLARTIGQRVEAAEIAASADFPEGAYVTVPVKPSYPPARERLAGEVEVTGTTLTVRLDNGETWEGPATLAKLAAGE
jgi:hypothetical protein